MAEFGARQWADHCEKQAARIAALEAQVAALAGAMAGVLGLRSLCTESIGCRMDGGHFDNCPTQLARAALTADVQHLAQLDAARREVCAAARQFVDFVAVTAPGPHNLASIHDIRAAIDALAKLEGR